MGAHNLGGASKENSGFTGKWTPGDENELFPWQEGLQWFKQRPSFYLRLFEKPWHFKNKVCFHNIF